MSEPQQPKDTSVIQVLQQELAQSNGNRMYVLALLQDAQDRIGELQVENASLTSQLGGKTSNKSDSVVVDAAP